MSFDKFQDYLLRVNGLEANSATSYVSRARHVEKLLGEPLAALLDTPASREITLGRLDALARDGRLQRAVADDLKSVSRAYFQYNSQRPRPPAGAYGASQGA